MAQAVALHRGIRGMTIKSKKLPKGIAVLHNEQLNKGTAFTEEERDALQVVVEHRQGTGSQLRVLTLEQSGVHVDRETLQVALHRVEAPAVAGGGGPQGERGDEDGQCNQGA